MKPLQKKIDPIPFTKEGYENLKQEKEKLLKERPEAVDHLKKARELGDLSENGYYKSSRQRLNFIDSRLRHLNHLLRYAVLISSMQTDVVELGSTVHLDDGKQTVIYSIVGGEESNPSRGTISHRSPLGKAVLGKRVGEKVILNAPAGKTLYTLAKIS